MKSAVALLTFIASTSAVSLNMTPQYEAETMPTVVSLAEQDHAAPEMTEEMSLDVLKLAETEKAGTPPPMQDEMVLLQTWGQ